MRNRSSVRKAVFPVAGRGTRFLPATKSVPKEMLPLIDRPLISYAVEEALASGIEELIFVLAPEKRMILSYFEPDHNLARLLDKSGKHHLMESLARESVSSGCIFSVEQTEPLGLGHAVLCARPFVGDEPFAVLLPDDVIRSARPCLAQLLDQHRMFGGNMAAVMDVAPEETNQYGVLDVEFEDGVLLKARGLVEKPNPADAPSRSAIVGRYVLEPSVFSALEERRTGSGGEIQLTDAIMRVIGETNFHGVRFNGERFDCGSKEGYLNATVAYALDREDLSGAMQDILDSYVEPALPSAPTLVGIATNTNVAMPRR